MHAYRHILAAVDLDGSGEPVLQRALELSRSFSARLSVIHVVEYVTLDTGEALIATPVDLTREMVTGAQQQLAALCDKCGVPAASARVLSGTEACELGLATYVADDPLAAALEAARQVAQKNPDAIRAAKRLMAVVERGDNAAILQAESDEQDRLVGSPNQREAVLANMEKRAPRFDPAR